MGDHERNQNVQIETSKKICGILSSNLHSLFIIEQSEIKENAKIVLHHLVLNWKFSKQKFELFLLVGDDELKKFNTFECSSAGDEKRYSVVFSNVNASCSGKKFYI